MAGFTLILIGCGGKLPVMGVLVAIGAGCEFHFVNGVLARRDMAFCAFHLRVLAFERVVGRVMLLYAEQ